MKTDRSFIRQLAGARLATAEILYHMPDHPKILQTYIWQDYDIAPAYPVLTRFVEFWRSELDGKVHSVRVAGRKLISAAELGAATEFCVN